MLFQEDEFNFSHLESFWQDPRHAGHPIGFRRILEIKFIAEVLYITLHIMVQLFELFAWIVLCSASNLYSPSDGAPLRDRS
jgi:hypothetical protein